ncbi:MAG: ABC transporter substrate binding protein [Azonexus sp.]
MLPAVCRLLFVFCLFAAPAQAENVALLLSGQDGPYAEYASSFRSAISATNWKISAQGSQENLDNAAEHPDLIIAVGSSALRQALARASPTPIIATLIPRLSYEKLLAESGNRNRRVSAIWLDQPPARQAIFLRHLLPGKTRIGMLLSNETRAQAAQFRQPFANAGLSLDSEDSESDQTLLPALNSLLGRVNILFAIPDSNIYKRDNIKSILITTYRYQRPVIAFSPAFVNAGALAALYSTPAQIARQTVDIMQSAGPTLPPPGSPNQFAILINQNVAEALNLHLQDEADIRRAMLADKEAR